MNILIPDSFLRSFLTTAASPQEIKEYVSLCGPSIERIYTDSGESVYDVEITTNRPDAMSVFGVAREASVILPRFGIKATCVKDPYKQTVRQSHISNALPLSVTTDANLNPRWASVILSNVTVQPSPSWLSDWLTKSGIRPINAVVDVTNYLMRAYGQPAHVFDYRAIGKKRGVPTMKLRASKPKETLVTLDGKRHTLMGDDIVIEDGEGTLIDLCGIMGGENSSVTESTTEVILFIQTYDPSHIRKTSMRLSHRTEASSLFEKGIDTELVLPVLSYGITLLKSLTKAKQASQILDIYPHPYTPSTVTVTREKLSRYVGDVVPDVTIRQILQSLGFSVSLTKQAIQVTVPSFRRDVSIDVDVIEEIARLYGYHAIADTLPEGAVPMVHKDPLLTTETDIKTRLRDLGYTEVYTYSLVSANDLSRWGIDKEHCYEVENPLSSDWVYLRPTLIPSVVETVRQNTAFRETLRLFELSMTYQYRKQELPIEQPTLTVAWTGEQFLHAKGLAEFLFSLFRIPFPVTPSTDTIPSWADASKVFSLGSTGIIACLSEPIRQELGIKTPVTIMELSLSSLVHNANPSSSYTPVPKYPPSTEDLAFLVPAGFAIGPLVSFITSFDPRIVEANVLDVHGNTRTIHIVYLDPSKTLTSEEIAAIRTRLLSSIKETFGVTLKSA